MRYVLLIGLAYKKYKRGCRIKISTGDHLIDDILLDQNIHETNPDNFESSIPVIVDDPVRYERLEKKWVDGKRFPDKMLMYEVEAEELGNDITIEAELNDNNYNNGFMTRTAELRMRFILLFPKHTLNNKKYYNMLIRWAEQFANDYSGANVKPGTWDSIDWDRTIFYPGVHRVELLDKISNVKQTFVGYAQMRKFYELALGGSHVISMPVLKKRKSAKFGTKDCVSYQPMVEFIDIAKAYRLINTANEDC